MRSNYAHLVYVWPHSKGWFRHTYSKSARYGTKADHYNGFKRLIETFPDMYWIAAHLGGDPEHPDNLEALLERYPQLYFDTSATKWQVREVTLRRADIRMLICKFPERFLFGSDLVTRPSLPREHYTSRYWCQRTLWESDWEGQSPIEDPDWQLENASASPPLASLSLPNEVLQQVYYNNAKRLLQGDYQESGK